MYNSKLLSIITISRYYDKELFKTIKSVDNEFSSFIIDYKIEHIIVCSEEVEYVDESKRKYLYTPPKGIYNAMNIGLNNATGEWIWFLNAGDKCVKGIAIGLLHTMNSCNEDIIKSGIEAIGQETNITFGKIASPHQGTFYRKNILTSIGGYREDYKIISDRIVFDIFFLKKVKMYQSNLIVAQFYKNGISSTKYGKKLTYKESFKYAMEYPISLFRWYRYLKSIYNYLKCLYENK
jgi:glycosyltransferase involved in cell wall biosynthesis